MDINTIDVPDGDKTKLSALAAKFEESARVHQKFSALTRETFMRDYEIPERVPRPKAPGYALVSPRCCHTCKNQGSDDGWEYCEKYDDGGEGAYVCDDWEARE